ncbi:hypothetical protein V5N11_020290 [Cardamine amara subsp. amara]|uniref:Reverse transcriptase domain-containing protein n=1 Tax=Cardamine amara subsp. amara TaxID=228776 RepID=A0ABD1BP86_CARAN
MAIEVFGELLKSRLTNGTIGYHPLGHNPAITHLAFAYDVMIFFDGSASSLQGISATLDEFHLLSGLAMNRDKTSIFYVGLNLQEVNNISLFGF